jgi:HAD superfamily hydrolase (TIGR01459 family)
MAKIRGLSQLLEKYDTFLIDLYGVVHDGQKLFDTVNELINKLLAEGKQVIYFSNNPRPKEFSLNKLKDIGAQVEGTDIVTSGDVFIDDIKRHQVFTQYEGKAYVLGPGVNPDLIKAMEGEGVTFTNRVEEADFLILLAFIEEGDDAEQYDQELKEAAARQLPALVPNPDIMAPHGDAMRYTSGFFAKKYESFSGKCYYYGKPHRSIYEYALGEDGAIENTRVLAIGDGLNTDIEGAHRMGIDSVLILSGLLKNMKNIDEILLASPVKPTYILERLKL